MSDSNSDRIDDSRLREIALRVTRDLFADRARDLGAFGFGGVQERILEALRTVSVEAKADR